VASEIEPYKIALWGASRAGKTALLAYLLHATAKTPWDVRPTRESAGFVRSMTDRQRENRFPPPTAFEHADKVVYTLVNGPRRAVLSVEDRAGAKWIAFNQEEKAILIDADALMILVDPTAAAVELERQIKDMLDTLALDQTESVDDRPVAICVSKADELIRSPEDVESAKQDPERFVLERLKDQIRPELRTFVTRRCPNHQFFPVSAVGVRVRSGLVRPAVLYDEQLRLRVTSNGVPINLTEPFDWIFNRLETRA
jgi:hypothetical protein